MESRLDWYTGENSGLWLGKRPTYLKHERLRFFSYGNFRRPRDTYVKRKCCRFFSFDARYKGASRLVTYRIAVMLQMATRYGVTILFATTTCTGCSTQSVTTAFFSRGNRCSGNNKFFVISRFVIQRGPIKSRDEL